MDHCGKHPQQQNPREETQRKTKDRKRSAPAAAAAAEELPRSKITQHSRGEKRRSDQARLMLLLLLKNSHVRKSDESDGFDVGEIPDDVVMPGISMPLRLDRCKLKPYNEMAESALDKFNKDHGTAYKFVKLIKGNSRFTFGVWCRLTFQAKDQKSASPQNFQTLVYHLPKDITVHFCRFEPKGCGETSQ